MCGHFKAADAQQKLSYNLSSPAGQSLEKLVECLLAAWILREKQGPSYWRSGWENNTGLFTEALVKYLQTFFIKETACGLKKSNTQRQKEKLNTGAKKKEDLAREKFSPSISLPSCHLW